MVLPDQVELLCLAVQKKATEEAEKILEDAKKRYDQLLRQGTEEINRKLGAERLKLKRQAFQDARRQVDAAELEARRMVMATREEIFNNIMEDARERLQRLRADKAEYSRLLKAMIEKAWEIILGAGDKGIEIRCSHKDIDVLREILNSLPEHFQGKVKLSERPVDIEGGIMAYSWDGKQLVDLSFEAILRRIEPDIRIIAADRLFKGAGS